ncbi:HEPN domain-containing protein [bacterium]|nr:HEPN domain-containing protein [bacterium]MBU1752918.1 HEPN domain-containing protein [bacterium]
MEFDVEKTVAYWLDGAEYDMGVADAMYQTEKFPYALFMGHLALEKLLKALVVKTSREHAPYTHSLPLLAEKSRLSIPESILIKLREFMEFHLEARYPKTNRAFYDKCTTSYTKVKMGEIKEVFQWLKNQL